MARAAVRPEGAFSYGPPYTPSEAELAQQVEEYYATYPDVPRPGAPDVPLYGDKNALYGAYMERLPSENLLAEMVPANVRAAYSYSKGPITQRFFPERDLNYLRDVAEQQHYMPSSPLAHQDVPGILNSLYSYFDPAYRLAPFTQGAYYEEGPGGMYMHNTYNVGGVPREVNVLLPRRSQR